MQPTRQYGGMPVQFTVPPPVMSMQPQQNLNSPPGIHQSKTSANSRLVRYGNKSDAALPVGNPVMPVMYSHQPLPNQLPLADRKQYTVLEGRAACMMAQPLPVRTTHHAYVSHVEDGPYNFCLQLKSAVEEVLPKLRSILARQQIAVPSNAQLIPGSLVVAKGADDVLRRAVIMKILPDICDVYYIDFGNHEERRYSDIFQLPNSAAELSPAMAMQFCLSDIESLRITDANKEYFTRLLLGKQVLVQVTESPRPAFQCCELLWESRNVREILVSLTVPMQYHFHTPPSDNDSVVNVVYAEGPNQFYVQFKSEKDSLKEIELAMTKYSSEQPTVTDVKSINIGMPVGAIFPDDGNWYRALVMGITGKKVNVFYVDYGNRAEVELSKLCLISREMVAKWNTHAMECCLVGFDTVSPSLYLIEKLEEIVLGKNYKLKLHSILSALRLCVDLIDEEGNSVAEKMKSLPSEKKKSPPMDSQPPQSKPPREKNLVTHQDDDQTSQHSSDSGVLKKNKYQRPPLKADREKTDRGHKFENRNDRNKFEEKSYNFSQHDDRAENNYSSKTDSRSDWKKGAKKPYMDQAEQWTSRDKDPSVDTSRVDKPSDGNKTDWRSTDSTGDRTGWGNDGRGRTERNDRGGSWNNNKFERKPPSIGTDGDWGSKDKPFANKFGDRDNKYGDRDNKYGDRDNKYGDRENKYGDRDNKFGDRGSRFGDRDNRFGPKGNKFGDRDTKFSSRAHDNKFGGYDKNRGRQNFGHESSSAAPSTEDCWDDTSQLADNRSSVVISEYPHQRIVSGQEYKVVFAHMDAPNDVFMHLENCDPALNKIRDMIDADTSAASRPISKPVLASPVLAKFDQDGLLYRALIKSLAKVDNGEVDVLFVDFGNSSVVPLTEVFAISSELMSIPIQAIHVIITDLPTIPGADLDACQAHFPDEGLTLKPSSTVAVNMVQCVQGTLFLPSGKSVAEAIIADPKCAGSSSAASSAVPVSVVPTSEPPSEVEPASEVPPPTVPAGAWVERLDLLVGQTISAKVVEKLAADLYSLCASSCSELVFPAQSDKRLSFDLTVEEEVIINVRNLLQDKLEVKYYDKNGKSLSDGDSISPVCPLPVFKRKSTFLLSHKEQESIYLQQDDSGSKLVELLNDMFDYYETNGDIPKETFKVNDVCAAQSSLDGNWYRARIEAVSDVYRVRYIDYGNMEEVGFDKTKLLSPQFTVPELCVPVSLPVKYTDLEWCFQRLDALGEAPVECTFIKKDTDKNCWLVDLSAVGAKDNFAVQWIKDNKAESLSTIPADPKFRDPGWDLRKGDLIPIVVTHVDSPDVFWVQLASHLTDIDTLQSKLQELPECSPESNDIFVAKYGEDGLWYRAVPLGDEVRFIDYGNTEVTQDKKNLPENLMFPIKGHAFPVRLCVSPVGNEWSSEGKDAFDAFIEKEDPNDFKKAKIISVDFETVVDLKCGDELLSTILISGGHAVPRDTKLNKREAKNAEVVNKAANCADSSSVGTPKIVVDEAPKDLVTGYVTSAISINDFYFHIDLKTDAIEQMAERLLQAEDFEVIEQPSVGDYLIAKIPKDSAWYRVTVLSKQPVEVLLVDYGEVSPATEFRKLPLDLSTIPVLAWHCSANIDDPQVEERFLNLVDKGTAFEVKFTVVKDDKHVVDLSVDGESIKTYQTGKGDVNNVSAQDSAMVKTSNTAETTSPELPPKSETQVSDEALPLPPSLGKSVYKDCILVHSNGPYDFYVQTDDDHIQIDEMANALFEADGFPKLDSVKTGDFVVAQYPEDDAYYRAVVIGNDPPVVKFTDNGISSPATSFHELPEDLKRIPQLAVRCSLQSPPGGWTADAIDQFATLLNSETKSIDLKILTRGDPNIVDVEISGSSLTQKLGPDAKKETSVTGEAKPFDSSNQPAEPPKTVNDEFPVVISFATSPTDFYYQKDASAVADLASRLLSAEEFKPLEECVVGKLICAKYPEDELWYRAKVVKAESPIEVFFVDYGNLSEVQELRQLPDDLSVKPPLSVKASLRPVKQTWSDDEIDKFLTIVYEGEMMCSMIEETPDHQVVRLKYQDGDMISYLGRTA